jgi:hypothetical protein
MARPVYSTPLAHVQALPGGAPCFSVPAGFVYVIRAIEWYQDQPGAAAVVRLSETVANLFWYAGGMPTTRYSGLHIVTHQAFLPGMSVLAYADVPTTIVRLSGYSLQQ